VSATAVAKPPHGLGRCFECAAELPRAWLSASSSRASLRASLASCRSQNRAEPVALTA